MLRRVLPARYAPLQQNGNGIQSIYLTELPETFAEVLGGLIGSEFGQIHASIPALPIDIRARRGQALFKERVREIGSKCRVTKVDNIAHLVASHCKPWRDSSNEERLNGENGLLLTPSIDHRFDRGFIVFEDSGELIISPVAHRPSLQRMGIEIERVVDVGHFTEGQRHFLDFHRNSVLLRADIDKISVIESSCGTINRQDQNE